MAGKAPGKYFREGVTLVELLERFPDEAAAERWFIETRWPDGITCPKCNSKDVQDRPSRKPQPYRCRACRKDFSLKTGTVMHGSPLPLQTWVIATYLLTTSAKGVSSMKLHRDLGVTQKTAWFLCHRLRKTHKRQSLPFRGAVEIDETYIGGKERNKHADKKLRAGRGGVGKATVIGARDRATNQVSATVIKGTDAKTLQAFVTAHAAPGAIVYTDEHASYKGLPFTHETVCHSVGEYVRDQAHTNGIESFWALLKRGYHGTYHHMSVKHLQRYIDEFCGRRVTRNLNTIDQMASVVRRMEGRRLRYRDLVG